MKIQDSLNRIYQNPAVQAPDAPSRTQKPPASSPSTSHDSTQKLNIPDNFEPQVGLSRKERRFFEQVFPQHKKQIQAYLDQQNKTSVEKGQYIDVKG
ncbi:MAG: hypothetical protein GXO78_03630 [Calditrichaeota bacterium]|nr:hypothetical protein [Calditrichota bacterium]